MRLIIGMLLICGGHPKVDKAILINYKNQVYTGDTVPQESYHDRTNKQATLVKKTQGFSRASRQTDTHSMDGTG